MISDVVSNRSADDGIREGFQAPIQPDTPVADDQVEVDDPIRMAAEIKRIAEFFGADLCGITEMDERWVYTSRVDTRDMSDAPNDLPESVNSVIAGSRNGRRAGGDLSVRTGRRSDRARVQP